ncbi:MAG: hypothetical protein BWX71_00607 [Deltaproteobacteria bacterium ADurb.Bin072]|nr:MAG: hypothetical protein BWX71_00607 [Deltaproteobacteria bacterium ADurb.Bin072]
MVDQDDAVAQVEHHVRGPGDDRAVLILHREGHFRGPPGSRPAGVDPAPEPRRHLEQVFDSQTRRYAPAFEEALRDLFSQFWRIAVSVGSEEAVDRGAQIRPLGNPGKLHRIPDDGWFACSSGDLQTRRIDHCGRMLSGNSLGQHRLGSARRRRRFRRNRHPLLHPDRDPSPCHFVGFGFCDSFRFAGLQERGHPGGERLAPPCQDQPVPRPGPSDIEQPEVLPALTVDGHHVFRARREPLVERDATARVAVGIGPVAYPSAREGIIQIHAGSVGQRMDSQGGIVARLLVQIEQNRHGPLQSLGPVPGAHRHCILPGGLALIVTLGLHEGHEVLVEPDDRCCRTFLEPPGLVDDGMRPQLLEVREPGRRVPPPVAGFDQPGRPHH